ncbi:MAG: formyltransferase family protein [Planctomycetota bacterium]|nr:formyltransferase family protein [Planctomycetota bacterium]
MFLTNGGNVELDVIRRLRRQNLRVHAIVHQTSWTLEKRRRGNEPWHAHQLSGLKLFLRVARFYAHAFVHRRNFPWRAEKVFPGGPLNSATMRDRLLALQPDLVVLGGIGILSPALIQVARLGVINAHPGLLPWVRGCGVVGNALLRGVPVGATAHYIDVGIDTGPVIERRLLALTGREESLGEIERAADGLAADMLVEIIGGILKSNKVPLSQQQTSKAPICRWLSADDRAAVDQFVKAGRAKSLFDQWSQWCVERMTWCLPVDFQGPDLGLFQGFNVDRFRETENRP